MRKSWETHSAKEVNPCQFWGERRIQRTTEGNGVDRGEESARERGSKPKRRRPLLDLRSVSPHPHSPFECSSDTTLKIRPIRTGQGNKAGKSILDLGDLTEPVGASHFSLSNQVAPLFLPFPSLDDPLFQTSQKPLTEVDSFPSAPIALSSRTRSSLLPSVPTPFFVIRAVYGRFRHRFSPAYTPKWNATQISALSLLQQTNPPHETRFRRVVLRGAGIPRHCHCVDIKTLIRASLQREREREIRWDEVSTKKTEMHVTRKRSRARHGVLHIGGMLEGGRDTEE